MESKGFIAGFRSGLRLDKPKKKRKRRGKVLTERERRILMAVGDEYGL